MNLLFGFSGRINRVQWWLGLLSLIAMFFALMATTLLMVHLNTGLGSDRFLYFFPLLFLAFFLSLWPFFALCAKRFHDRNKSGFWSLIIFIPIIGKAWLLAECGCLEGNHSDNKYGPPPEQGPLLCSIIQKLSTDEPSSPSIDTAVISTTNHHSSAQKRQQSFGGQPAFGKRGL